MVHHTGGKASDVSHPLIHLRDHGGGRAGLILPGGRQLLDALVVAGQAVDAGLNQDEAVLGIAILGVAFEVLAHLGGALHQEVQILRDLRGEAVVLEDAQDLTTGHVLHLGNTHGITQLHADLAGHHTLAGALAHHLHHVAACNLQPRRGSAAVGESGRGLAPTVAVHAHHCCLLRLW
ncbi:40S ribosomal protein S13, putative [Leishmania tarentolae]|uniref:40S ribosomal protein S13, putative n=1 Tax=Leishmania tarentolae TaxID=5689 RepID=A0A640KS32_LEITA|nr:40S ribosomal protein S13, putative [Leishmania tarentolae]